MRGDLKDAVSRRVDDRRARAHMFRAKLLDDFGSGRRAVADRASSDSLFELAHDFGRKSVWEKRKGLGKMDAGHLPVPRGRVLAWGCQGAPAKRRGGRRIGRKSRQRLDVTESQPA